MCRLKNRVFPPDVLSKTPDEVSLVHLTSMPMYTAPQEFRLNDLAFNMAVTKELLSDKYERKILKRYSNGTRLMHARSSSRPGHLFYFLIAGNQTYYFVDYEPIYSQAVGRAVYQSAVWRAPKLPVVDDFVKSTIIDRLLRRYGSVCSDSVQTPAGAWLWKSIMGWCLKRGFHVGILNESLSKVYVIKTKLDLELGAIRYWGDGVRYQNFRAVISTRPFKNAEQLTTLPNT